MAMESGLSSALAARLWRIPRLRPACFRLATVLAILYAGAIAVWGGAPPEAEAQLQVTEHISKELQQKVYVLDLIPRQCTGKGTSEYSCWEVYPTAWQALDKSRKGISLVIHLWVNEGPPPFKDCDLEMFIDGAASRIKGVHFQPGSHFYEGATATVNDYDLVRTLALANDVILAADVTPRIQITLTPEMQRSIYAVYSKYNSLEAPGSRLEQLNAKLSDPVKRMRDANTQYSQVNAQDCTTVACLNKSRSLLTSMLSLGQSIVPLLDEKIAFLTAHPEGMGAEQEKNRSIESRTQLNEPMKHPKALLEGVDKKLASRSGAR